MNVLIDLKFLSPELEMKNQDNVESAGSKESSVTPSATPPVQPPFPTTSGPGGPSSNNSFPGQPLPPPPFLSQPPPFTNVPPIPGQQPPITSQPPPPINQPYSGPPPFSSQPPNNLPPFISSAQNTNFPPNSGPPPFPYQPPGFNCNGPPPPLSSAPPTSNAQQFSMPFFSSDGKFFFNCCFRLPLILFRPLKF